MTSPAMSQGHLEAFHAHLVLNFTDLDFVPMGLQLPQLWVRLTETGLSNEMISVRLFCAYGNKPGLKTSTLFYTEIVFGANSGEFIVFFS